MRLYWEVARATLRRMTTYRAATLAGVVTNTVFGFLLAYVMQAVFAVRPGIRGFDATDAVTFVFVAQGLIMTVGLFGEYEMADRIKSGDVAVDLSRPYDFQAWWAGVAYGKAGFYAVGRGVLPFLIASQVLGLRLPERLWVPPAFLVAVALAVGVAFALFFLLQLTGFWILDVRGPVQMGSVTGVFLSGLAVPLVVFPDGAQWLVRALPFACLIQFPVEVFLGKHQGLGLVGVYAAQAMWLVVLVAAGRLVLARATRKVEVQGG